MSQDCYVNVFRGRSGLEAHDGVWRNRSDAVDAAEQYADSYEFTLSHQGKIDLTAEFSEEYQDARQVSYELELKGDERREAARLEHSNLNAQRP